MAIYTPAGLPLAGPRTQQSSMGCGGETAAENREFITYILFNYLYFYFILFIIILFMYLFYFIFILYFYFLFFMLFLFLFFIYLFFYFFIYRFIYFSLYLSAAGEKLSPMCQMYWFWGPSTEWEPPRKNYGDTTEGKKYRQ